MVMHDHHPSAAACSPVSIPHTCMCSSLSSVSILGIGAKMLVERADLSLPPLPSAFS